jgi:hypothetical protein
MNIIERLILGVGVYMLRKALAKLTKDMLFADPPALLLSSSDLYLIGKDQAKIDNKLEVLYGTKRPNT